MRLMRPEAFRETYFDKTTQPDLRTIRNWVRIGELPGEVINGYAYVDADAWERRCGDRNISLADFRNHGPGR